MFRLFTSNDATKLATALGERLAAPCANPLVPARVLVPQAGLKRWLQVRLAEQLGVLANVDFTPPAQFAWELLRAAQPDLPERSPFDVDVLRWHVHGLLAEPLQGAALAPLRDYLARDGDPLRRYALSLELARVFERMQGYRRDKLLRWERGDDALAWQAELWRRLLPRVGGVSRAARVAGWLHRFDPEYPGGEFQDKPAPPGLPAHFACFACANVSPDVLRMLAVAGRHCDVDFYLPLPSRDYLGDTPLPRREVRQRLLDKSHGNPLVVSQGGALAGFVELLYGYEHVRPDEEVDTFDDSIDRGTLLGRVRDDILQHAAPRCDDGRREALPDGSLQFHACHTPLREVQTLHDALLAMFAADTTLQPRDIVVMMPDVAAYAPAIAAVFGGIEHGDPRLLPFNLGDAGAAALHPVAQLFLDLLDAPSSRWQANEILDVLAVPGVQRRFDLDSDAVERLSRRLREAGVRWGEDERARAGCGDYREFSWAFGLDRALAGFACGDAADTLVGDTAPLPGVEGEAFSQLDAVFAITGAWRRLQEESRRPRVAAYWRDFLNGILGDVYRHDPRDTSETRALERIRDTLANLARDCDNADPELALSWAELRAYLRDALAAADPRQYLFTGGITFCGMVPLRVVPFRVICLLGMDETAFPRREAGGLDPLLADRRAGNAKPGDRDVRADDRLLFLQLLAAARDAFYVSWVGRDPHTNEMRPPSVVVSELIDALRQGYLLQPADDAAARQRDALLPRVAPLHPFDASLFDVKDASPRSFHREWLPAARTPARSIDGITPFVAKPLPTPATLPTAIQLDALKHFFDDPARGFLEGALHLRLPRDAEEDADLEPLQPDHPLLRYDLATALLDLDAAEVTHSKSLLRAQGRLPPGELADAALAIAGERASLLRAAIDSFSGGETGLDDVVANVVLDGNTALSGTVRGIYPGGLVRWSPGGLRGKRVLRAWLDTLFVAIAYDAPQTCRFLWIDSGKLEQRNITVPGAAAARAHMARLATAWRDGQRQPLPLFPDASAVAFKLNLKKKEPLARDEDRDEFVDALAAIAANADDDGGYSNASDFDKPSVRLAWRGIAISRDDIALATRLHDAARNLFPRLQAVTKDAP